MAQNHTHRVSHSVRGNNRSHGHSHSRRSDIRLKQDIVAIGHLDNGVALYRFRYKGGDRTIYVGVMAQEILSVAPEAVTRGPDGYLRVDYDRLGAPFMTWKDWRTRAGPLQN